MRGTIAKKIRKTIYEKRHFRTRRYFIDLNPASGMLTPSKLAITTKHRITILADNFRRSYQQTKRTYKRGW